MSAREVTKAELLRRVEPVIMRIAAACDGVTCGITAYACLSFAVVAWRKTGLSLKRLHLLVDDLAKNDEKYDN